MRSGMIALAALAFAASGGVALAQTNGAVTAYAPHTEALAPQLGDIVISGRGYHDQNMLLAQLNERSFGNSNDTMEQSPAGGMATAGSAGGVGD